MEKFKIIKYTSEGDWAELLLSAQEYSFLQSWQFGNLQMELGNIVERHIIFLAEKPVILFQTLIIKAKRGNILQLRNGPVFLPSFVSLEQIAQEELIRFFLLQLNIIAKEYKSDLIRVQARVLVENPESQPFLKELITSGYKSANIHNIDAQNSLILDLKQSDDDILKAMRPQTRYYVRKAQKDGVSIERINSITDFYEIHHETTLRQKFTSYSLDYYEKYFKNLNAPNSKLTTEIFFGIYKGQKIATAIIVYLGKKAFYSDGGSLTSFNKLSAAYLIQWEAILRAKELGCETYDFWGGLSPDKTNTNYPWYGIDLFKRGFGGEKKSYMHPYDLGLTWKYQLIRIWEYLITKKRGY